MEATRGRRLLNFVLCASCPDPQFHSWSRRFLVSIVLEKARASPSTPLQPRRRPAMDHESLKSETVELRMRFLLRESRARFVSFPEIQRTPRLARREPVEKRTATVCRPSR